MLCGLYVGEITVLLQYILLGLSVNSSAKFVIWQLQDIVNNLY